MKKLILSFGAAFMLLHTGIAQKSKSDANIIGDVQCKGEHVPFINITIDGTTIGTMTDATGHF